MSDPIVSMSKIDSVAVHPNADKLELVIVGGLQYIVGKGEFKEGDPCLIIGPDSILPQTIQESLGLKESRVRVVRLRKEISNGVCVPWEKAQDWFDPSFTFDPIDSVLMAKSLGITKFQPPVRHQTNPGGYHYTPYTSFQKYTDIQNINNWPDVFQEGEEVWVSEKIDGQNFRIGVFIENGTVSFRAGSRNCDREFGSPHWKCFEQVYGFLSEGLKKAVKDGKTNYSLVLYGELYGAMHGGYDKMDYGYPNEVMYRFFDICENGVYWNKDRQYSVFRNRGFPVPHWYTVRYNLQTVRNAAKYNSGSSKTLIHMREGIVITPAKERVHPKLGRVILKCINPEYLIAKGDRDATDN